MNAVAVIFVHTMKLKQSVYFPDQAASNLTNHNSEFFSSTIQYEEKPELINEVYKVFISNSISIFFFIETI